jgi:hypothetical protein
MKRAIRSLCLMRGVMGLALQAPALADSVPFWGAKTSVPKPLPAKNIEWLNYEYLAYSDVAGNAAITKTMPKASAKVTFRDFPVRAAMNTNNLPTA